MSLSVWTVLLTRSKVFHNPLALRLRLREDLGTLEWERGRVTIHGQRQHVFGTVIGVSAVRQPLSWLALIGFNLFALAMSFGRVFSSLTPENPLTWVVLVGINALLVWSTITTKCIRVTYEGNPGEIETVYLLPVSAAGHRRFDNATERLIAQLERDVIGDQTPQASA